MDTSPHLTALSREGYEFFVDGHPVFGSRGDRLGLGMLCTVLHSAENQAPLVRRARVWVSMGG